MELTPAMKQYMEIKNKHKDCIVFFRMGDFYETFYEDAKTAAKELDIVLTSRGKGEKKAPLAGLPFHALDSYLGKLINKGYKVCIVEQLEDPKLAKGIVKRGVSRIVTPGTIIEDNLLNKSSNNFIMSLNTEAANFGMSFCDISTGEFITTEVNDECKLFSELEKYAPAEIIVPLSYHESKLSQKIKGKGFLVNSYDDRFFMLDSAQELVKEHFNVHNLDGFGISEKKISITSSGALISYLKETQRNNLRHISKVVYYSVDKFMIMDSATQRNLELLKNIKDGTSRGSLFDVINKTVTSMGTRKLKGWLLSPLLNIAEINERLDSLTELKDDAILQEEIKEILSKFSDIERINARIIYNTANPRDLLSLKNSLELIPELKKLVVNAKSFFLKNISNMPELKEIKELIEVSIKVEPSITIREGNIIKKGYNKELDELREISGSGKEWLNKFEEEERERTGIKNLRVKYNKIFGYYIEVTKSNLKLVPDNYIRRQTQANSERYITEDLKKKENIILGAQDKIYALEYDLFIEILGKLCQITESLRDISTIISSSDCILSLSIVASENNYTRPHVINLDDIEIIGCRHPVVEKIEDSYVPNDCIFNSKEKMKIITGPNMSGKSTYLRQNALIIILSQIGSYVPADSANIGVVDRIFTRVGAFDDLSMGQSTFMVEMTETANILNNATEKSFVILDEIGRGTSTYDGFSLAWAIAEYLYTELKAKTLFATHYHQLNKMTDEFPLIKNYHVLIKESKDSIVFLRKIIKGGTDKSYGIQVAKLAGLPKAVIEKSYILMKTLEEEDKIMKKLEEKVMSQKKLSSEPEYGSKSEIQFKESLDKSKISIQQTLLNLEDE